MRAAAQAPGMFAALAEGLLEGDIPFSVACPVDSYARAEVRLHERDPNEPAAPPDPPPPNERVAALMAALTQNAAAVERTLTHLARPDLDAHTFIGESLSIIDTYPDNAVLRLFNDGSHLAPLRED